MHVEDIADAHVAALERSVPSGVYNLGTNQGTSNLEVIHQAIQITGVSLAVEPQAQRDGDPAQLTAESIKFQKTVDWQPKYTLQDIIQHAWAWYNR